MRKQTEGRSVQYARLPPGAYEFKIFAGDEDGRRSPPLRSIHFTIQKPCWNTWWFYLLVGFVSLAMFYGVVSLRVRAIRRTAREKNRINKKMAELELQALQSQMNPHFVFNALGAIQFFIRNTEIEMADDYLAKFGLLMRLFLESSKNKFIPLADEIRLIQLYIKLEKIRFEDRFDVSYEIDDELVDSYTLIPSLLFQPFVENAINHGLFHKKEKGYLSFAIKEAEEALICIIEDNGIGRERATELKQKSTKNYKSRGTQIVKERLEVLEKMTDLSIAIKTEDCFPGRDEPGTRVIIEIPFLE